MRACVLLGIALACSPVSTLAQAPPPPPMRPPAAAAAADDQAIGTGQLSGRVFDAGSARPLRGATVRAVPSGATTGWRTSTDAEGRWTISHLPEGHYEIRVSKTGYSPLSLGQRRPFDRGTPVEVADGQTVDKLDVSLPKGSAITGRILDEVGEPMMDVRVSAMQYRFIKGERRPMNVASGGVDTTDDLGQFRLHGLPAGEYYVSATKPVSSGVVKSSSRVVYAPAYYPGMPNVTNAQRVALAVGQEASGIVFSLAPARVVTVSGRALTSAGAPLLAGMLRLIGTGPTGAPSTRLVEVAPDGSFTVTGVAPGLYHLDAQVIGGLESVATTGSSRSTVIQETAWTPLTVGERDVTGVIVETGPAPRVSGRVIFEGGTPADVTRSSVGITLANIAGSSSRLGTVRIADDWTIEIRGLQGLQLVRAARTPPGWWLKSVTVDGADVTDTGVDIPPSGEVDGLEITFSPRMASVSGRAQTSRGAPVTEYAVVIFEADSSKWGPHSRFVRAARPDQSGMFRVEGLPEGHYLAVAIEALEPGSEADPDLLEHLRADATGVRLREGDSQTLTLTVGGR